MNCLIVTAGESTLVSPAKQFGIRKAPIFKQEFRKLIAMFQFYITDQNFTV